MNPKSTILFVAYYEKSPGDWRRWTAKRTLEEARQSVADDDVASKKPIRYFKETRLLEEIK